MKNNLIVIMADQLRSDVLSKELTPNIWSIKEEGISFDNAYTACPLCVPSRGAFFTGTYPNRNGSLINPWVEEDKKHGNVKKDFDNLYSMMMKDWEVIHSGKQHLFTEGGKIEDNPNYSVNFVTTEKTYHDFLDKNGKRRPGGNNFKTLVPEMVEGKNTRAARYSNPNVGVYEEGENFFYDSYFTTKAIQALKERKKDKPLFLSAMYVAPHPPLDIPEKWFNYIDKESVKLPSNVGEFYKYQSPLQLYNITGKIGSSYDKEYWKESWRVYLGLVSYLDYLVGQILDEIKEEGIYDDSLIIFTSDHGEMLGSHSLYQKMCMYEESAHVPLFMKFPKNSIKATKKEYPNPVSLIDIVPTLCEFFNLKAKHKFDGKSLLPIIEGKESKDREIYIQYDGNGSRSNFQRCIICWPYKLIVDIFKDEIYLELYSMTDDREEKENLIFSNANLDTLVLELLEKLRVHMEETGDLIKIGKIDIAEFRRIRGTIGTKPLLKA